MTKPAGVFMQIMGAILLLFAIIEMTNVASPVAWLTLILAVALLHFGGAPARKKRHD